MRIDIPALAWDIAQDVAAGTQQLPEFIRGSYATRITTPHANNGDRFTGRHTTLACGELRAQTRNLGVCFFKIKVLGFFRENLFRHALLFSQLEALQFAGRCSRQMFDEDYPSRAFVGIEFAGAQL